MLGHHTEPFGLDTAPMNLVAPFPGSITVAFGSSCGGGNGNETLPASGSSPFRAAAMAATRRSNGSSSRVLETAILTGA